MWNHTHINTYIRGLELKTIGFPYVKPFNVPPDSVTFYQPKP